VEEGLTCTVYLLATKAQFIIRTMKGPAVWDENNCFALAAHRINCTRVRRNEDPSEYKSRYHN